MLRRFQYAEHAVAAALGGLAVGFAVLCSRGHDPDLPNPRLTPGDVLTTDLAKIREPGFERTTRDVDQSKRNAVARRYGLPLSALDGAEVDHLIPASWGGASTVENLWVQPYRGAWGARVKDRLEVHGLAMIRRGELDLQESQAAIAKDWKALYRKIFNDGPQEHLSAEHEQ